MNMKNIKGRRMPFENEIEYTRDLMENHPDPSAEWGGGSGGDTIQAGEGIVITTESDDTKTISVDTENVAMVTDLSSVAFSGDYDDLSNKPTIPTNYVTTNTAQDISESKRFILNEYGNYTSISDNRVLVSNYSGDRSTRMENEKLAAHYHWMDITENMEVWADGIHYTNANQNDATTVNLNFNVNPYENENYYITFPSKNGTVALTSELPDAVSGTDDGTNWTSLTIGNDTYNIPQGGKTYTHYIYVQNNAMNTTSAWRVLISIQRSTNTAMTWADVCDYLESFVDTSDTNSGEIPATGIYIDSSSNQHLIYSVMKRPSGYFTPIAFDASFSGTWDKTWTPYYFKDLIAEN